MPLSKDEEAAMNRLCQDAGHIIEMLKHVFTTKMGLDIRMCLIFSAGLAGYACHRAVIDEKGTFAKATTKNNKNFYFGDDVNRHLIETPTSVISSINAVVNFPKENVIQIVQAFIMSIGDENMKICGFEPAFLFNEIKQCWDGIYDNMTAKYCKSPAEYPMLFGIVVQNILVTAVQAGAPKNEAGKIAMEAAIALSRMDDDSI